MPKPEVLRVREGRVPLNPLHGLVHGRLLLNVC